LAQEFLAQRNFSTMLCTLQPLPAALQVVYQLPVLRRKCRLVQGLELCVNVEVQHLLPIESLEKNMRNIFRNNTMTANVQIWDSRSWRRPSAVNLVRTSPSRLVQEKGTVLPKRIHDDSFPSVLM
jgi:hypothetical protein